MTTTHSTPDNVYFIKNVKIGDILWFVTSKSKGKIIAVATYASCNNREHGPLIDLTPNDNVLGWENGRVDLSKIDTEIHYSELYGLSNCELLTHILSPKTIRKYNPEKCAVNLPVEYSYIVKYSKMTLNAVTL